MQFATWILVFVYVAIVIGLVVRNLRKTRTMRDFALGSNGFPAYAVALSLAAGMTSAATFIINPGFIAYYGLSGVLSMAVMLPLGAMLSLVVITRQFRHHGSATQATTMAQWMGNRFGNKALSAAFAVLSLLLVTFIVLINVGVTKVLAASLNISEVYVLTGIIVFVFGYMMFGGANAMVYTNVIQAMVMLVVAVILLGSGYAHFSGGVSGFLARLNAVDPMLTQPFNPNSPLYRDFFEVVVAQFVVGIAIVCQPHIITRSLLLRDARDVNRYLTIGIVVQMLFFAVVFAGLYARLDFTDLMLNGKPLRVDSIMSQWVVAHFPVWVGLLVVLGMIFAGISTLEGLIQSLSATITTDIIGKILPQTQGDRAGMITNRIVIVLIGVIAWLLSWDQLLHPNLSVGLFAQNGVYAYFSAAFVPVLMGTFMKKPSAIPALAGALTAIVVHFSVYYGQLTPYTTGAVRNPGVAAAIAILSASAVALILSRFFRSQPSTSEVF